jgi:hypothetical protein
VLVALGAVVLLASVLDTLRITFRPTSLFNTLMMLGLSIAGVGLMARALLVGHVQNDAINEDREGDENGRLQVQLAVAHDRIRALEAPPRDEVIVKQPSRWMTNWRSWCSLKRNTPPRT